MLLFSILDLMCDFVQRCEGSNGRRHRYHDERSGTKLEKHHSLWHRLRRLKTLIFS